MSASPDLQKLREPFPDSQVGKLPRVWCKACKEAGKGKTCSDTDHKIVKCQVCGQKGTSAHLHLDYVGHAEVTHRLLDVDPAWSWEPFGVDADGLPAVIKDGNDWTLWIRLTVGGVTKPGVGCLTVERFTTEPYKQLISDALRNAAMRFGVALDLWAKSELDHKLSTDSPSVDSETSRTRSGGAGQPPDRAAETSASGNQGETTPSAAVAASENDAPTGGQSDAGGREVPPASDSNDPKSVLRARIDKLNRAQKLNLKALWKDKGIVPLDDAVISDGYFKAVSELIDGVEAA